MDILVQVALILKIADDFFIPEARPEVSGKKNLRLTAEEVNRFVNGLKPGLSFSVRIESAGSEIISPFPANSFSSRSVSESPCGRRLFISRVCESIAFASAANDGIAGPAGILIIRAMSAKIIIFIRFIKTSSPVMTVLVFLKAVFPSTVLFCSKASLTRQPARCLPAWPSRSRPA